MKLLQQQRSHRSVNNKRTNALMSVFIYFRRREENNYYPWFTVNDCMLRMKIKLVFTLLYYCHAYDPTVIMPYKEILGSSSDINIIGNAIQCTDMRGNVKICAEDCFTKHSENENCVGFLMDGNNCSLCTVLNRTEVDTNQFSTLTNNHKIYLLKSPKIEPDIYISMDDFNLTTGIITGNRVSWGSQGITADDLITGKVGQAIHFNGGYIKPAVDQPECFCSFHYCNGTVTVSFWAKSYTTAFNHVITPQATSGIGVAFATTARAWFNSEGKNTNAILTTSILSSTEWVFLAYGVDIEVGISVFFNAVKETFRNINDVTLNNDPAKLSCSVNVIGAKFESGAYEMKGDLDEVKYFYRVLTPTGVVRNIQLFHSNITSVGVPAKVIISPNIF